MIIDYEPFFLNKNWHYLILIGLSLTTWYFNQSIVVNHMEKNSVFLPGIIASIITIAVISSLEYCIQIWYTVGKEITITQVDFRFVFLITFAIPILFGVNVVVKNTYEIDDGSEQRKERRLEKEWWPGIPVVLFKSLKASW